MIWLTSSYDHKQIFNHTLTMIWEEGHHIFINLENKYNYTFSSSSTPRETLIWFCCFSSPRNSASKLCNTRRKLLGQRCGQRESRFLQHNNAKIQVFLSWTSLPLFIPFWRDKVEEKVVTNEGVSCISTQTTQNTRVSVTTVAYTRVIVTIIMYYLCVAKEIVMNTGHTQVLCRTSHMLKVKSVSFCNKKYQFEGNSGNFQNLVSSRNF